MGNVLTVQELEQIASDALTRIKDDSKRPVDVGYLMGDAGPIRQLTFPLWGCHKLWVRLEVRPVDLGSDAPCIVCRMYLGKKDLGLVPYMCEADNGHLLVTRWISQREVNRVVEIVRRCGEVLMLGWWRTHGPIRTPEDAARYTELCAGSVGGGGTAHG